MSWNVTAAGPNQVRFAARAASAPPAAGLLAPDALQMAIRRRRLADARTVASVGSRGGPCTNAMAEAFNSPCKAEHVRSGGLWRSLEMVRRPAQQPVPAGELGSIPPTECEALLDR